MCSLSKYCYITAEYKNSRSHEIFKLATFEQRYVTLKLASGEDALSLRG